ncbi:MAG: tetratricopeptide repeat protein [Terriglobia bacterium]
MSFLISRKVLGTSVIFAVLLGVIPAFSQTGGLSGVAKGEKGERLVGYPVIIERQDVKGTYPTKTNKKGEYIYIGLPIGNYKVSLKDPSGRELFYQTLRVGLGDPTVLDFDLAKERVRATEEQQKQLAANPELAKKKEAEERDAKQFTGLKQTFEQGQALMSEKKYADAAAMFEQALPLAKEKNVPVVLARLAQAYAGAASVETNRDAKTQQREKALQYYAKAIEASPTDATLHNNLGSLYADMGKTAEAQQEFQKAAEINPAGASGYYYNMGVVFVNKNQMDEAATALKKSTELDPTNANAFYWLGMALLGKAEIKSDGTVVPAPGTVEAFEQYLKLDPNGQWAASAQGSLAQIQGKVETQYKAQKKKKS